MTDQMKEIAEFTLALVNNSKITTDDQTIENLQVVKRWLKCIMSGVLEVKEVATPEEKSE